LQPVRNKRTGFLFLSVVKTFSAMGYKFKRTDMGAQITRPDGTKFTVNKDTNVYLYQGTIVIDLDDQTDIYLALTDVDSIEDKTKFKDLSEAFDMLSSMFKINRGSSESQGIAMAETPENKMVNLKISGDAYSFTDPLPSGGVKSSDWLDISNFDSLNFIVFSDVPGSYKIEYSQDKQHLVVPAINVDYDEPGLRRKGVVDPDASFVRFTYTNGNRAQNVFSMLIRFKVGLSQPSLEILGATGAKTRLAQWVKSVLHIIDENGLYDDVYRKGNSLLVHVDNPTPAAQPPSITIPPFPKSFDVNNVIHAIIDQMPDLILKAGQKIGVDSLPDVKVAANQSIKAVIDALPAITLVADQSIKAVIDKLPELVLKANQSINIGSLPEVKLAVDQAVKAAITSLPDLIIKTMPDVKLAAGSEIKINNPVSSPVPALITNTDYAKDGTDITGSAMPAGGSGIRGWLSAIYKRLIDGLTVISPPYPLKFKIQPSGAGGNFTVIKNSPGTIGTMIITNTGTVTVSVMLYDKASAPVSGDNPDQAIPIQAGQTVPIRFEGGMGFANGIGIGFVVGTSLTNLVTGLLTLITGGQITVNINYK
jgi:hypothetical protein